MTNIVRRAWIIESGASGDGPRYLAVKNRAIVVTSAVPKGHWTDDHNEALQLARKEDAEALIKYLFPEYRFGKVNYQAIEHIWGS